MVKLYVVGEASPDPQSWIRDNAQIVAACNEDAARLIASRPGVPVREIKLARESLIADISIPKETKRPSAKKPKTGAK